MRRRLPALLAPALAGALLAPAPAKGAQAFRPCAGERAVLCARVAVPLDRSGVTPGTLRLDVQRVPARTRRRDVLVVLAGGPGQSAIPLRDSIREVLDASLSRRELVVFDQRGTGRGALRCPSVEAARVPDPAAAGAACAARLGPRRAFFTTRDSVGDLEAVRVALGVERLSLLGVSYGTKVALAYAIAHPGRVDRLVLDSPVAIDGPDPFGRSAFAAVPRVLRDLCRGSRCAGVTRDPVGNLATFAGRLRIAPLRGTVIGSRGQRRRSSLHGTDLIGIVFSTDLDPTLLSALPAATRSALRGDPAPILRLATAARRLEEPQDPSQLSTGLFVATLCEEGAFPWPRTAPGSERRVRLEAASALIGDAAFAPFDRAAATAVSIMPACLDWPAAPAAPTLATSPPPSVPVMLVSGTRDLRTPLEDARGLLSGLPEGRLLTATGVGHSVISANASGCPERAVAGFLAGRPVRRECARDRALDIPPDIVAPLSLREVRPVSGLGGRRGRTVGAALLTLGDLGRSLSGIVLDFLGDDGTSVGGLRGGFATLGPSGLRLRRVVYVPGVTVSGRVSFTDGPSGVSAVLSMSGRAGAHGTVRLLPSGAITGRLDGRRFRLRFAADVAGASEVRAARASVARLRAGLGRGRTRDGRPLVGRPPRRRG